MTAGAYPAANGRPFRADCAVRDIAITMKGDAMKLCITSTGRSLDSDVDPRFGRCAYFIILDSDSMEFEVFENDSSGASGGAGVQSGKFVADKGAKIVLTGNVGPKAFSTLSSAGIEIITGMTGITVRKAVEDYLMKRHSPVIGPTAKEHSGLRG